MRTWKEALLRLMKRPDLCLYAVALDLIFLFTYGIVRRQYYDRIMLYVYAITANFSKSSGEIVRSYSSSASLISTVAGNPDIGPYLGRLLLLFIALGISIYILYTLLQGASWHICRKVALEDEISYYQYFKGFAKVNILWIGIFFAYSTLRFLADLGEAIGESITQTAGSGSGSALVSFSSLLIFLAVFYFTMISYAMADRRKAIRTAFRTGFANARRIVPDYGAALLGFVVIGLVLTLVGKVSPAMQIILDIIAGISFVVWAKVLLIRAAAS